MVDMKRSKKSMIIQDILSNIKPGIWTATELSECDMDFLLRLRKAVHPEVFDYSLLGANAIQRKEESFSNN